jgi:hypothetical protein
MFDVSGPPGKRFDYLMIDPDDHYLIFAHLAAVEGVEYVPERRNSIRRMRYLNLVIEPFLEARRNTRQSRSLVKR